MKRFGGSSRKPDAKFGETREAHNYFCDWECRGHKFAFDAGVSFLTTVDRGCIYLICGELVGEEGFRSIHNLSRRSPQVLFDRGMGEYGWAQELEEAEWDELLARLGLEDVISGRLRRVLSVLDRFGFCGAFQVGPPTMLRATGKIDRCPLPVLDAALRLCARVKPRKESSASPLTPLKPLRRHLDDEGNDAGRWRSGTIPFPWGRTARGATGRPATRRRPRPRRPRRPRWTAAALACL